ncbi:vacuolar sorting protein vps1 [Colletotrichum truncatum]|uniref:Vacuolar sorting protein vps1 n=1 Tax=Colletotrichum truncatum TaxID=5467 RepID=A0ACC3Z2W3_COLTU|nr:vacuolar sorting protein vps1 [Colletotrichum truncatum]KAF6793253.1 vacuolar sorting protein vps1 [Colletotrichum truncatum]
MVTTGTSPPSPQALQSELEKMNVGTDVADDSNDSSDTESQASSLPSSVDPSPGCDDNHREKVRNNNIPENPFDSESSRILFDAIDRLQSFGVSGKLEIPQLVIVGGQSSGKSSLLQSLTEIPFPVGKGCCTRFATRIVSRRTAPGSDNVVKITITEPEVEDIFDYPFDDTYEDYNYVSDHLGVEEFKNIMEEVSTKYMGIKSGEGIGKKNFAAEVLRIELSGPSRSYFSILDVPGIFSFPYLVNESEMHGIKRMVEGYMRQPANIVICVADAVTDLSNQEIFKLAASLVDKNRLVGVFTKCDMLHDPTEVCNVPIPTIVDIASGNGDHAEKTMHGGWFVVRNRAEKDGDELNPKEAENQLFSQPVWKKIREDRRGSSMLKKHLGNLLCARIRANFPSLQGSIRRLLLDAQASRRNFGDARPSHHLRQQYLRDVVDRYHHVAVKTLKSPGSLSEEVLRVRSIVREANESFTADMRHNGHSHQFEDEEIEPTEKLANAMAEHYSDNPPIVQHTPKSPSRHKSSQPLRGQSGPKKPFVEEIRNQLRLWQATELPGLINTEVIKVLYKQQSENWQHIAEKHIATVASSIETASNKILQDVCSHSGDSTILFEELSKVLDQFQRQTKDKALMELREHCRRERQSHLQTTDVRFHQNLQTLRSIRLLNAYGSMPKRDGELSDPRAHLGAFYHHCHHSMEDNMVGDVHDVVKVYYQLSIEAFIRYVTNDIIEDFISYAEGPLMGLSTDWIFGLTEEEVERFAREDDDTVKKRAHFDGIIEKLQLAEEIAEKARKQTRSLGDL